MGYSHCDLIALKHMFYLLDQCRIKLCSTSSALLYYLSATLTTSLQKLNPSLSCVENSELILRLTLTLDFGDYLWSRSDTQTFSHVSKHQVLILLCSAKNRVM